MVGNFKALDPPFASNVLYPKSLLLVIRSQWERNFVGKKSKVCTIWDSTLLVLFSSLCAQVSSALLFHGCLIWTSSIYSPQRQCCCGAIWHCSSFRILFLQQIDNFDHLVGLFDNLRWFGCPLRQLLFDLWILLQFCSLVSCVNCCSWV
jgi:hypothetical protein